MLCLPSPTFYLRPLQDDEIVATLRAVSQQERVAYYKAMRRHDVVLPHLMMPAVLRDVDMAAIMASGNLPVTLFDSIDVDEESDEIDLKDVVKALEEEPDKFSGFMNAMVMAAVLEPKITLEGDEESLSVRDLAQEDKDFIMEWVNRGAKGVRSFRQQAE